MIEISKINKQQLDKDINTWVRMLDRDINTWVRITESKSKEEVIKYLLTQSCEITSDIELVDKDGDNHRIRTLTNKDDESFRYYLHQVNGKIIEFFRI